MVHYHLRLRCPARPTDAISSFGIKDDGALCWILQFSKRSIGLVQILCFMLFCCGSAHAEDILLFDDFSSESLDMSRWDVATWKLGRTHFGKAPVMKSEDATTFARFSLETYNPSNPGDSFLGTAIYSNLLFSRTSGLVFEARLRVINADTAGQVAAFFSYETDNGAADEIDYEFLTSQKNDQVLLTSWDNGESGYALNDGTHHADANPTVSGMNISDWTTVRFFWLRGSVRWEINGTTVHKETAVVPDQAMKLHLSLWAPDASWPTAYAASLIPVSSSTLNTAYSMDIDYVKVSRLPGTQITPMQLLLQD